MAAIEVITSQERAVEVEKVNGQKTTVLVRVWNETVSNLTLMALGSSAPEILLSVIEIFGNNFEAGDLGPSTMYFEILDFNYLPCNSVLEVQRSTCLLSSLFVLSLFLRVKFVEYTASTFFGLLLPGRPLHIYGCS